MLPALALLVDFVVGLMVEAPTGQGHAKGGVHCSERSMSLISLLCEAMCPDRFSMGFEHPGMWPSLVEWTSER